MATAVAGRPRPAAPPRLAELLDSDDERMRLEPAKAILDLIELVRKRRAEPVTLDERAFLDITPCQSDPE